jgi:hypothetical protein
MKVTLDTIALFLAPLGIILAQFNKVVGAAILGAAITLFIVNFFQHYEIREKGGKK